MYRCFNCNAVVALNVPRCPVCGQELNWNDVHANVIDESFQGQMSDAVASGGKTVLVIFLMGLALPVILFNPLIIYWGLLKKRYFNISQPARKLAFWTSFLYTGLVITQLTMMMSGSLALMATHAKMLTMLATGIEIGLIVVFGLEIVRSLVHDQKAGNGGFKRIRTAIFHFIAIYLFFAWAGGASILLTKVATYSQTPVAATKQLPTGAAASASDTSTEASSSSAAASSSSTAVASPFTSQQVTARFAQLGYTEADSTSTHKGYASIDGVTNIYHLRGTSDTGEVYVGEAITGQKTPEEFTYYNQQYGLDLEEGDWFIYTYNGQTFETSCIKMTALTQIPAANSEALN